MIMKHVQRWVSAYGAYAAWAIALVGMLGSLYFSEIAGYTPCVLCWYQRIAMYPLIVVIGIGILRRDRGVWAYALPLSVIGGAIALYQNLLVWHVITEKLAPCQLGVSCITQPVTILHFVTIPLLSLTAFVLITVLMFIHRTSNNHG